MATSQQSLQQTLNTNVDKIAKDADIFHIMVNGDENATVETENGIVKSAANRLNSLETEATKAKDEAVRVSIEAQDSANTTERNRLIIEQDKLSILNAKDIIEDAKDLTVASKDLTLQAKDSFFSVYLGASPNKPVETDSEPIPKGALWYDTKESAFNVFNGDNWNIIPTIDNQAIRNNLAVDLIDSKLSNNHLFINANAGGKASDHTGGYTLADGTIKLWGSNKYGLLGKDIHFKTDYNSKVTPPLPFLQSKVKKFFTNGFQNFAVLETGEVYTWGLDIGADSVDILRTNTYKAWSLMSDDIYKKDPTVNVFVTGLLPNTKIVDIILPDLTDHASLNDWWIGFVECGGILFIDDNGGVWANPIMFPEADYEETNRNCYFKKLKKKNWVKFINIGFDRMSQSHTITLNKSIILGIDENNKLYIRGEEHYSNNLNSKGFTEIKGLENKKVKDVSASHSFVDYQHELYALILLEDGTVWSWGDNSSGQLGLSNFDSNFNEAVQVDLGTDNDMIFTNAYTSYVVKKDGRLFASGANRIPNNFRDDTDKHNKYHQTIEYRSGQPTQNMTTNIGAMIKPVAANNRTLNIQTFTEIKSAKRNNAKIIQAITDFFNVALLYDDGVIRTAGNYQVVPYWIGRDIYLTQEADQPIFDDVVGIGSHTPIKICKFVGGLGILTREGYVYTTGIIGKSSAVLVNG